MRTARRPVQAGLTLVELLVAMALSLVVAIAAGSVLVASREGFSAVDSASQLRDNARFSIDLITRVAVQAGFRDVVYAATTRATAGGAAANPDPAVYGASDARPDPADPGHAFHAGGVNGSDVLVLRYQIAEALPGSGLADPSFVDCSGQSAPNTWVARGRDDVASNIFYVDIYKGEPSLMCTTVSPAGAVSTPRPLVSGVETFQVLFGTDGVTPGTAPSLPADSVADSLLGADRLSVSADAVATYANWRRVRSIRVGMILRGPVSRLEDRTAQTFLPLGSGMSSATDSGSTMTPPVDGRLRQAVTFTIHLRNDQGL